MELKHVSTIGSSMLASNFTNKLSSFVLDGSLFIPVQNEHNSIKPAPSVKVSINFC